MRQQRELIDKDYTKLKEVYLESLNLESYGVALVREIYLNQSQLSSINIAAKRESLSRNSTFTNMQQNNVDKAGSTVEEMLVEVKAHLSVIAELSKDVYSRLWANIDRFWEIAPERPADLVTTFEVIEMHQELQDRRKIQLEHRAMRGTDLTVCVLKYPIKLVSYAY